MLKLLIIADDFTGALDTGVQFSDQGIETLVTTNKDIDFHSLAPDLEVLVIDSESRYLSFEASYTLISSIIQKAKSHGVAYIYKKVDSALRGNISSELKALADQFPDEKIAFVPAFPAIDRIVKNGELLIDGRPVAESVFASDPYEPVTESNIAKRLQEEASLASVLCSKESPSFGAAAEQILLFDSETDDDLRVIAQHLAQQTLLKLSVGCAGFAKYLPAQLFPQKKRQRYTIDFPLLVISGSVNPITHRQIDYAEKQQAARFSLQTAQLTAEDFWDSRQGQDLLGRYLVAIKKHDLAVFETLNAAALSDFSDKDEKEKIQPAFRFQIGRSLGKIAKYFLEKKLERTLFFIGGDTLFQSMQVLGLDEIQPLSELYPGVVLSLIVWQGQKIQLITKSGGFGQPDLLEKLNQSIIDKEEM
ncbi:four-carbon acid sugar kinase family protein [Streptococcus sp. H31]|uniref:four-carbon acid sugar kinase family protein n=1 Tax=Streptococcus huangxiaojuni TaxID=3237239 RepID=UPI0034A4B0A0